MKVKVLKAEGKGKKKGLFINHIIFDAPIDPFQCNNRLFAFEGHLNAGSPDCLSYRLSEDIYSYRLQMEK